MEEFGLLFPAQASGFRCCMTVDTAIGWQGFFFFVSRTCNRKRYDYERSSWPSQRRKVAARGKHRRVYQQNQKRHRGLKTVIVVSSDIWR